jgi:hypothetical protein
MHDVWLCCWQGCKNSLAAATAAAARGTFCALVLRQMMRQMMINMQPQQHCCSGVLLALAATILTTTGYVVHALMHACCHVCYRTAPSVTGSHSCYTMHIGCYYILLAAILYALAWQCMNVCAGA